MTLFNCGKVVNKLPLIKQGYHGQEIKDINIKKNQIVKIHNGLIQKINILLCG